MRKPKYVIALPIALLACSPQGEAVASRDAAQDSDIEASAGHTFQTEALASFDEPWAMAFEPETAVLFVTEKAGSIKFRRPNGSMGTVSGVPKVDYGGQGGLGDFVFSPDYDTTGHVFLSWIEAGTSDTRGAVVGRAKLECATKDSCALTNLTKFWEQSPKVEGRGHFSHRIAFSPGGQYIFISSGERQKFDPAQDMNANLGKIVRLNIDGTVPADNPFYDEGGVTSQIWSLGHRNLLGLAFDGEGRLWNHEMGPRGGDELNLVEAGKNYGYPIVSNGDHYDGREIPDHDTRPEFEAPKLYWNPVISPAGLIFYDGSLFPKWQGNAFIGGLSSKALIRVSFDGTHAREAERFDMGQRIREVEQGPDGAIYLLEDSRNGSEGRLLRLTPKS